MGNTAVRLATLLAVLLTLAGVSAGAAGTATSVKVFFAQGEQLVAVQRPGATVQDSLSALVTGPTSDETARSLRSYVPPGTRIRSVTMDGTVAVVDLGSGFMQGNATDTTLARLDQVVSTVTAAPGVTAVRVLINGGTPIGLFPGVDATVPLTRAALATPNVPATAPVAPPTGPVSNSTRAVQEQLAALGYLLPANVDGVDGPGTQTALVAFQKWQGLSRTGLADAPTRKALATAKRPTPIRSGPAGRRIEVLVDRQVVLAIQDNEVVRAIDVSTGKPSTPTPIGTFSVYAKYARWWSTPFREWLLWASPFTGGIALHQYPDVPTYAASHGCVRVTQYDSRWVFDFVSVGTQVVVIARST
ncbi:MAG TPA: L,D-transpeptidase family protein [Acidimicrobiia bacterium]